MSEAGMPPAGAAGAGGEAGGVGSSGGLMMAPTGIRMPLLISGILNCVAALGWAAGCVTAPVGIPLVVLAVFEFKAYAAMGDPGYRRHANRVQTLQILEICSILLGNIGSLICGIVGMVFASEERKRGNF